MLDKECRKCGPDNRDFNKLFEDFCEKYSLVYDFTRLGVCGYKSNETHRAFIVWSKASGIGK